MIREIWRREAGGREPHEAKQGTGAPHPLLGVHSAARGARVHAAERGPLAVAAPRRCALRAGQALLRARTVHRDEPEPQPCGAHHAGAVAARNLQRLDQLWRSGACSARDLAPARARCRACWRAGAQGADRAPAFCAHAARAHAAHASRRNRACRAVCEAWHRGTRTRLTFHISMLLSVSSCCCLSAIPAGCGACRLPSERPPRARPSCGAARSPGAGEAGVRG